MMRLGQFRLVALAMWVSGMYPFAAGAQTPPSQGQPPPSQPSQSQPAQQAPPVQPPPQRQPLTQQDMQPGGPVFMRPQFAPPPTWRAQLRAWAQHPEANVLRRLSQRADAGLNKPGVPPQQGQQ